MTNTALTAYSIQGEVTNSKLAEIQTVYGIYLLET